ncbi:hypothetical protein GCM10020254_69990 [Streptomyces goshikiensis]
MWFVPEPLGGRTAFLFPGLEPEFAPALDDVADLLGRERARLGRGTELMERALDAIATGRFFAGVLPELGIEADVLAGHSLGEWAAMVAGGMYPRDAADAFLDSLRPGSLKVPDLVYAALGCGAERARAALHGLDGVVVSHDNCPHQSVVCGDPAGVSAVLERLRSHGVLGQELPFRSGFHTPMWEPYLGQVRAAFARLPPRPGTVPVWSATTCAEFPSAPEEVRELVVRHLLEPVRFRELTLRLYEDAGVRSFVTLGPGSLPGFVEDTLRGRPHLAVSTSAPRLSGLDALRRACAALWSEGHAPDWNRLRPRRPRPPQAPLRRPAPRPAAPRPRHQRPSAPGPCPRRPAAPGPCRWISGPRWSASRRRRGPRCGGARGPGRRRGGRSCCPPWTRCWPTPARPRRPSPKPGPPLRPRPPARHTPKGREGPRGCGIRCGCRSGPCPAYGTTGCTRSPTAGPRSRTGSRSCP